MNVHQLKAHYAAYKAKQAKVEALEAEHMQLVDEAKNSEHFTDEHIAAMQALNSFEFNCMPNVVRHV